MSRPPRAAPPTGGPFPHNLRDLRSDRAQADARAAVEGETGHAFHPHPGAARAPAAVIVSFDEREAATILGVHEGSLRARRKRGTGPRWYALGPFIRYREEDLDEWLAARNA